MEKIFEDKEFHGLVKFFRDISLPNGGKIEMINKDNPDSPILSIKRYGANWWGALETVNILNDDNMDVSKSLLSSYIATWVTFTEDFTPTADTESLRAHLIFGSTGTLGGSKALVASKSLFQVDNGNTATIPNAVSNWSLFTISGDAVGTVTNYFAYRTGGDKWGTTAITNFYGFYSEIAWASPTNGWHFYGVGDYPSFFGGDIQMDAGKKFYLDGGGDTYLQESAGNVIDWVAGGQTQMYNSGNGMFFPRGVHTVAVDKTADNSPSSGNTITIYEQVVNVIGVTSGVNDQIYLPRIDQVENGHPILIMCDAGSNFEIRTPTTRADKINTVDCGTGGNEYLATDTEVIKCVKRNTTDGWVLTGTTALGAVAPAVVPDA